MWYLLVNMTPVQHCYIVCFMFFLLLLRLSLLSKFSAVYAEKEFSYAQYFRTFYNPTTVSVGSVCCHIYSFCFTAFLCITHSFKM